MPSSRHRPAVRLDPETSVAVRSVTPVLLLGFVMSWLPTPWRWLALLPLAIATYRCLRARHLLPAALRAMRTWLALMAFLCVLLWVNVALPLVAAPWTADYRDCMTGAQTQTARAACQDKHGTALTTFLGDDGVF